MSCTILHGTVGDDGACEASLVIAHARVPHRLAARLRRRLKRLVAVAGDDVVVRCEDVRDAMRVRCAIDAILASE